MTAITKVEKIEQPRDMALMDIENVQNMSRKLMQTKHYQKIGEDGIFAICMMAKSIGMPQLDALNGELYYVQGKVGMAYEAMNKYIRLAGHSVSIKHLDEKSCVLVGKRKDSGDVAEITYTIEDAKRAGKTYDKHPKTMLFARCLSMLKRFLFPDVCTKCYVKEELDDFKNEEGKEDEVIEVDVKQLYITDDQAKELNSLLSQCSQEVQKNFTAYIVSKFKINGIDQLPESEYDKIKQMLCMRRDEYQAEKVKQEAKVNQETGEIIDAD